MKPIAFLDLSIFAVPNSIDTIEGFNSLFGRLEDWASRTATQNCINIVVSDNAIDDLTLANCFPALHNIQALLEMYDISHVFSARDLNKRIFRILSRSVSLSDAIGIRVDQCTADCSPTEALENISEVLLASAHKLACAVGVFLHLAPDAKGIVAIVQGYEVQGAVLDFAGSEIEATFLHRAPPEDLTNVDEQINVAASPKDFLNGLLADSAWVMAEQGAELALPIALRAAEKLGVEIDDLPLGVGRKFSVGESFYSSLAKVEALGNHKHAHTTLDRCATVVADNTLLFERDFQKNRRVDSAEARRVHLTKGGVGLRLMFWERTNGGIEFANVGPKHEEVIVEGNPKHTFEALF
ncbi:hypothetical protein LB533_16305 [Mesorhizobium sp. BR1-1-13]|uniref:hypothetical protein n=1 Tax=Mesorhizobium sp. BR1-1-13 TaxID=2876656 RepID=UPI001CD1226E|nr:hypothetical protein [Mesorhizobium sp. BR1-1-13]MBZ9942655.1 hypothetical protein [Mesorhizobium sp. BR1-1-13]